MARPVDYRLNGGTAPANLNTQTADYTLTPEDNNKIVMVTSSSGKTVTVPSLLPLGFNCLIVQGGTGQITVSGSGATVNNVASQFQTSGRYAVTMLISTSADVYIFSGSTA